MRLLRAFRRHAPKARVVVVSSSRVYGRPDTHQPAEEASPLDPSNLYGVTKMAADLGALHWARHHRLPVMTARPVNHIGPGQSPQFAIPAFAQQLIRIARQEAEPVLRVGNLESVHDFLDVRDVARAYRLLLERGRPGCAYNIASGTRRRVGDILEAMCRLARVQPRIETDPDLFRPTDRSPLLDTGAIRRDTGWAPRVAWEDTLRSVLEDAAARLGHAADGLDRADTPGRKTSPSRPASGSPH
jgi:GDP-4-dehydro-6-deoxy-D-mannose reductase